MFPYFYPTTVALIDDDLRFLESLDELLQRAFIVRRFESPQAGLNHLVGADAEQVRQVARLGAYARSASAPASDVDRLHALLTSYVGQLRGDARRFEMTSVAVVDLNMPGVDGLMICRALRRRPVRTILLTANASERVAIDAFNEGLIDRFISKHEPNLLNLIVEHIRDLQGAFFRRITTTIRDVLTLKFLAFMTDGVFLRYFDDLCRQRQVAEYYVRAYPPGVDLIRADGDSSVLVVLSEDEVEVRVAAARDAGAPSDMLEQMDRGEIITHFPSEGGYYEARFRDSWQLYAVPAKAIVGKSRWLTAVMRPSAIRPLGIREFVTYNDYMRDHQGA